MTLKDIKDCIKAIEKTKWDDETAHSMEDDLHVEVLDAIASGTLKGDDAKEAAALALKTQDIDFARWCA